jgi:hypothetical protein
MSNEPKAGKVLKLRINAERGAIAENPDKVFRAVLSAACTDGANEGEWVDAIVKAAGGSKRSIPVNGEPKFQFLRDTQDRQVEIYEKAMKAALSKISDVLEQAEATASRPEIKEI